jgi:ribonucleoside-diphosphate reductase alpha chain
MTRELIDYFEGDELASSVWLNKYALTEEVTPEDMHKRLAKEFIRVEKIYQKEEFLDKKVLLLSDYGKGRPDLTEEAIYDMFKDFKQLIPQGSIMSQLGSSQIGSLSNCFVVGQPVDSYGGIFQKEQEMIQLMKRRGGVGIDISTLRPEGTVTTNAAKSSTGAVSFMHRFSNGTREVAQKGRRGK